MTGTSDPSEPQPYAPEGLDRIGTPPSAPNGGTGGERGTSAFPGNSEYDADGSLKDSVRMPSTGAARGEDYYLTDDQRAAGEQRSTVEQLASDPDAS